MKNLILFITLFALVGCADTEVLRTDILREKAVIVTLIYSPSQHNVELTQTAFHQGDMIGTDYSGNTGIKVANNMQLTTTEIPERFGVAFQCQHGTFTIEGIDLKHKTLYNKLQREVGDTVNILYKEEYLLTYKTVNKERMLVSKVLRRLDFVDAQK